MFINKFCVFQTFQELKDVRVLYDHVILHQLRLQGVWVEDDDAGV